MIACSTVELMFVGEHLCCYPTYKTANVPRHKSDRFLRLIPSSTSECRPEHLVAITRINPIRRSSAFTPSPSTQKQRRLQQDRKGAAQASSNHQMPI